MTQNSKIYPIVWQTDHILLIDQARLPREFALIEIRRYPDLIEAIQRGMIQSAAIIEIAVLYGLYLGVQGVGGDRGQFLEQVEQVADALRAQVPKSVQPGHLRETLTSLVQMLHTTEGAPEDLKALVLKKAQDQHLANLETCYRIGAHGVSALPPQPQKLGILTCGNGGALASAGYGTALGVVRSLWQADRLARVYIAEGRPTFEGAKLSAWECVQEGIPVTLMTDSMVAWAMQQRLIHGVVVGAASIAANGDTVNPIGTYSLAVTAQAHQIPFVVAAPLSTIDFKKPQGSVLAYPPVDPLALAQVGDLTLYPSGVEVYTPSFDLTPGALITAIVTEKGVTQPEALEP